MGSDQRALMDATAESGIGGGVAVTVTRGGAATGAARVELQIPDVRLVAPDDLPDYYPAFRMGAARADIEGRLWIRTTEPSAAGPIYDIINGEGVLVDRVRLPYGRVIAGFGPGVVYMGVLDDSGARLEKAKLR
jgi:hypothetical protein